MKTVIILIRHGQTEWNRIERFRGQVDIPLNVTGIEQAEKTARQVTKQWKPSAIYSSPLSRAQQTAERIARHCGLDVQTNVGLTDIHYGKWQGLTPAEVEEKWPELLSNWYRHPEMVLIPGGESLSMVRSRAILTVNQLCEQHPGQEIVLVSHTVVNRLILLNVIDAKNDRFWQIKQEPCAINVFEKDNEAFIIHSINCVSHL